MIASLAFGQSLDSALKEAGRRESAERMSPLPSYLPNVFIATRQCFSVNSSPAKHSRHCAGTTVHKRRVG